MVAIQSPDWLPPGFTVKVKFKNGRKIKYYYNVATDTKYYSKKDVLSFATDDIDKQLLGAHKATDGDDGGCYSNKKVLVENRVSPERLPKGWKMEKRYRNSGPHVGSVYKIYIHLSSGSKFYSMAAVRRYLNAVDHASTITVENKIDNVNKSCLEISPESKSMASAGRVPEKEMKTSASKMVSIKATTDNDLPPGWIKETRTRKSWKGTRKDLYYTDTASGYVFRSKLDALRYLETNDIGSCASNPCKRKLDDLKLINNEFHSSNLGDKKLSKPKRRLILGGDSNGGEASCSKSLSNSKVKRLKRKRGNNACRMEVTSVGAGSVEEKISGESPSTCTQMDDTSESKHQLSESVKEKQINRTKASSKKTQMRKSLSLPSRRSKRLPACKLESPSTLDSHETFVKASDTGTEADTFSISPLKTPTSVPRTSDIEPPDVAEHELIPEKIVEEVKPLDNVEKLIASEPAVPNGRSDGIVNEKELGKSKKPQESQLNYDFGDSWSDPLDFAFKTLRGEIKLEDTLGFSGDLNDPLNSPFNEGEADPFPKPSQYDEPILFHNEFVPCSEPSKEHGTVGQLQLNSSLSSEIPNTLQAKSSLPSPSLNQHATIDLSLANSSVSLPSFNQRETIANSFRPHGAFAQFPANSSSAPLKQYGAVGLSQANSSFSFPYFKEYGSVGPMHANSSLFSPSFRQSGTISQWLPTNSSFDNSSLFSLSSKQPGTVGQWPPTNLSTENSSSFSPSFRQPGTVSQWPPTNPTSFSCPGNMEFSSFSSFNAQSSADARKKNNQTKFNP